MRRSRVIGECCAFVDVLDDVQLTAFSLVRFFFTVPGKGFMCARRSLLVRAHTGDYGVIPQKMGDAGEAPLPPGSE